MYQWGEPGVLGNACCSGKVLERIVNEGMHINVLKRCEVRERYRIEFVRDIKNIQNILAAPLFMR